MDRGAVEDYVARSESVFEASPQMDEANTKAAVLSDFLDLLGWEVPTNTQLEYPVEVFGKTYNVDYALILEGTPVAFFESKGVDTPLKSDHEGQLSDYMKNQDVNYGILSNGKEYRFYQRRVTEENVTVRRIIDVKLESLPKWTSVLNEYTKPAIEDGGSGELERINELRDARRSLAGDKDELATEIANLLNNRVSETISSIVEPQTKELIDRIVENIDAEISTDATTGEGGAEIIDEGDSERATGPAGEEEYTVRFYANESESSTFSADVQGDVLVKSVSFLVSNRNLISKIEPLPYIPGRTRAIIHDSAEYDGHTMKLPKDLDGGYVLEANLSADQKKREIRRLADQCGLSVSFSGDW